MFIQNNEIGGGTGALVIREPGTETYTNRGSSTISILSGPNGERTGVTPGQTVTVPGRISYFSQSFLNLSQLQAEGWDLSLTYIRTVAPLGRFRLRSSVSYLDNLGQVQAPAPLANLAGTSTYPRVKMQHAVSWQRGMWNAAMTHNTVGHYGDLTRSPFVEVNSYSTLDAQIGWGAKKETKGWLAGTRLTLGIDNLFDRDPPLDFSSNGYRTGLVRRPAGRSGYVALKKLL